LEKGGMFMKRLTQEIIQDVLKEYEKYYDATGNPNIKPHKMAEAETACLIFQMLYERLQD
jgi:hypothetical protein